MLIICNPTSDKKRKNGQKKPVPFKKYLCFINHVKMKCSILNNPWFNFLSWDVCRLMWSEMEPESLCFQGFASLYFASMTFFPVSLGCDNGILWIITAVQSLINVCKTLRSSDEVCYVHPVQHIIANKHRLFLISAKTHSWCFSYHKNSHMRMAMMGRAKV